MVPLHAGYCSISGTFSSKERYVFNYTYSYFRYNFIVSFVGMNFRGYESRKLYNLHSLTDLLSNGYEGSSYSVGCGVYVVIIGLILGIAGCFIDIMKYFKKDINVDSKYMTNSINRKVWSKIYYHRWFYVMFCRY